jgi:hypothetical protein
MAWFRYGYFVRQPNGSIVPAGNSFCPTPDSYRVGDSLGVRGDSEGFVIGVLKGECAKLAGGYDTFVLVEQRRVREPGAGPPPPWDFFQREEGKQFVEKLKRGPARLVSRPQIQAEFGGVKFRAVGKNLHKRPLNESFYDFQVHHLLWHLGKEWFDDEMKKPLEERHIVLQWRSERAQQFRKYQYPRNAADANVRAPSTGGMRALQVLADDIYQLAHVSDVPAKLLARLRDLEQFQGARHEVFIASLFARCGFEVEFINDTSKRNPEFFAKKNGERIGVEAKSRHRAGVLNRRGQFDKDAPAEVKRLYEDAAGQNPGDCPFLIFIDVNLPLTPDVPLMQKDWVKEAMKAFEYRQQEERENRDTGLILTNFGWHFSREEGSPPGENCQARLEHPKYPVRNETWELLGRALSEYGRVADEEERGG